MIDRLRRLASRFGGGGADANAARVDAWLAERVVGADPALEAALAANAAAGMPSIDVSPTAGKLLHLVARMTGARRVLEIGTLGGYSTIQLARALPPDGLVVTLEASAKHAEVARANLARAGVADRVELRVGPALDTLPTLEGPFDLVFIDADKENIPAYFAWARRLGRPGATVIVDNVVRGGRVASPAAADPATGGVRRLFDELAGAEGVSATAIQTVGAKGWDGFVLAVLD